jgi:uncharacterized membrane protein
MQIHWKQTNLMTDRTATSLTANFQSTKTQYLLLGAVTLLAAILRFYKLGEWSFWGDEIISVRRAQEALNYDISLRPLTFILMYGALQLFGVSEWSARVVPALIGIISIPILYFPMRKLFGLAVALTASLFLALAPWHLYWSQNARFYALLLLFYTLALFTFYFGIEYDRPLYLIASLVFGFLAFVERNFAIVFAPILVCYLLLIMFLPWGRPPGLRLRNLLILSFPGLVGALFLVLSYLIYPAVWEDQLGWIRFVNNTPVWNAATIVYYLRVPVICMGLLGLVHLLIQKQRIGLLLGIAAILPPLLIIVLAPWMYTASRYVFISLTSWLLLASVAMIELFRLTSQHGKLLVFGVLLLLVLDFGSEDLLYYKFHHGNRDNWAAAFAWIGQHKQPGDLVISSHQELGNYYMQEKTLAMQAVDSAQLEMNGIRAWFVEDMTAEAKAPEVMQWLLCRGYEVANLDVPVHTRNFKMRIYLYEPGGLPVVSQRCMRVADFAQHVPTTETAPTKSLK